MSLITDLRAVSENAVEQLAARFGDLPRPLLAAIGAGDLAAERLAELRVLLTDSIGERVSSTSREPADVRTALADLPARAQKLAAELAAGLEQLATQAPAKAQEMVAQMPDRVAEMQLAAQSLSPAAFRGTVEAYGQLAEMIFGNLARRGDKTWSTLRQSGQPAVVDGAVVDGPAADAADAAAVATVAESAISPEPTPLTASTGSFTTTPATKPRAPRAATVPTVPAASDTTTVEDEARAATAAARAAAARIRTPRRTAPVVPPTAVVPKGATTAEPGPDPTPTAGAARKPTTRKPTSKPGGPDLSIVTTGVDS